MSTAVVAGALPIATPVGGYTNPSKAVNTGPSALSAVYFIRASLNDLRTGKDELCAVHCAEHLAGPVP